MTDSGSMLLEYLLSVSKVGMENMLLDRMADAQNRRKEIMELLDKWAERRAEALLIEWFDKHGAELVGSVTRTVTITELQRLSGSEETADDFRETLRNLLRSA